MISDLQESEEIVMASEHVKEITAATFAEAVGAGVAALDFWAPWCNPCRAQGPFFEAAAAILAGKAVFAKVNVDEAQDLAAQFGVRSIPTIVVLKEGKAVETKVGLTRAAELAEMVRKYL